VFTDHGGPAEVFVLLRGVMLQLLSFDPTQRLSAEAALKIFASSPFLPSASQPSASHVKRSTSPPPYPVEFDTDGDSYGDFWKLESILRVSVAQVRRVTRAC
jgi:hypothetical protein